MNEYLLHYNTPASRWEESLPLGNGSLGMMVFGRAQSEILRLNEESLWTGFPHDWDNPECLEHLSEMREAVFDGDCDKISRLVPAYQVCRDGGSGRNGIGEPYGSMITAGDLLITDESEGDVIAGRSLDLLGGVAVTELKRSVRTHFVSVEHGAAVTHIRSKDGAFLELTVRYDSIGGESKPSEARTNASKLTVDGDSINYSEQFSGDGAISWACRHKIKSDGEYAHLPDGICVSRASEVIIYTAVATSYRTDVSPEVRVKELTENAAMEDYASILRSHREYMSERMTRSTLTLESDPECIAMPTDERITRLRAGGEDTGLYELYFNFGKYLLLSSSSAISRLPANLQGIWCKNNTPPWSCDYHININIQMNYWPAEVTGLAECADAFFSYIRFLSEHGDRTAMKMYGCDGWVAHTVTTPWGFTSPGESPSWGAFVTAGAWCCTHIFEHFRYTADVDFLKKYWDILRGSAEFFLGFLIKDPRTGRMVTCPSNSPENLFFDPKTGRPIGICAGPTMDCQILRDLFSGILSYAPVVGETDADFLRRVKETSELLPENRIGKNGTIMEWQEDYDECEPGHRHISHLYGLYPSRQITKERTPELFAAAEKTIERRLSNGGGHTGWSRAWIINFFARLKNGARAGEELKMLLCKSTLPNLFDDHPPFQIDGNFGGCAAIAEMLLQNGDGAPVLLPALPPSWKNGSFSGFRIYNNRSVSCEWRDGEIISYEITDI